MKPKPPLYTVIHADPYNCSVVVYIGGESHQCVAHFAKTAKIPPPSGDFGIPYTEALMYRNAKIRDCCVWFPGPYRFSDAGQIATLTHEMAHATFHILCVSGVLLNEYDSAAGPSINDEAFTYLQSRLVREALNRAWAKNLKTWFRPIDEKRPTAHASA